MSRMVMPLRAFLFAASLGLGAIVSGGAAFAQVSQTAALLDPYDPVPEIGAPGCGGGHCLPHDAAAGPHFLPKPPPGREGAFLVDCSGMHRGMFRSVGAAVDHAPPGASILILPPGKGGGTCVESVRIDKPLTLASYGGGRDAVIEAPRGMPCLTARIPLGDALVVDGVRFIARGRDAPCLAIEAGQVVVRNSTIDSRRSNWAVDIAESVDIVIADSRIETDGSGLKARRAHVGIERLDIDIASPESGSGLVLDHVDGAVEGGSIVGGETGIVVSSGTRDVRISGVAIRKSRTGAQVVPGGLGVVALSRLVVSGGDRGIAIASETDAEVSDNIVTDAMRAGIDVAPHAHARVTGNTVTVSGGAECFVGVSSAGNTCHKDAPPPRHSWWPF